MPNNNPRTRPRRRETRPTTPRLEHLVLVRWSSKYNWDAFLAMIIQTLSVCDHAGVPGVNEVQSWEIDPFNKTHSPDGGTPFLPIHAPGNKAVAFDFMGVRYLYWMGTAAQTSERVEVHFVDFLCDLIRRERPRHVWAAQFARLVRNKGLGDQLKSAMKDNVEKVHVGYDVTVNFSPHTHSDEAIWDAMVMVVSMERDLQVQKFAAGKVIAYRHKAQWVFGPASLPPGYKLNADRHVVVDEAQVQAVRDMFPVLMQDLTAREMVARLGALGITTPTLQRYNGPRATFADAKNPLRSLKSLHAWLPTYYDGYAYMKLANSWPYARMVAGLAVENEDEHDIYGWLPMPYWFPVPDGGWVDSAVLAVAQDRLGGRPSGQAAKERRPLSGRLWTTDGSQFALISQGDSAYRIVEATLSRAAIEVTAEDLDIGSDVDAELVDDYGTRAEGTEE